MYRTLAEYLSVGTMLSPLFRYMQWYASRTPDDVYFLRLDPSDIDRLKLFPPAAVPVTGLDALSGAVGGPWDRLTLPVENHYIYQSVRAHLESGVPWSDTPLYQHPKYSDDPERARRRAEKIERLTESIETNGYRQQFDPDADPTDRDGNAPSNERIGDLHVGDELIVGLDRNGEFMQLKNGRHRLAVARYLGVEEIPVVLSLIHPKATLPQGAQLIQSGQ